MATAPIKIWLSVRRLDVNKIEARLRHPQKESTVQITGENVADLLKATLAACCALLKRNCAIEFSIQADLVDPSIRDQWIAGVRTKHREHAWQIYFQRPKDMQR